MDGLCKIIKKLKKLTCFLIFMKHLIYTRPQKRKMSTQSSARLSTAARVSPRNHSSTKERLRQKTPEPVAKRNRFTAPNAPRKAKRETAMRLAPDDSPMSLLLNVARQVLVLERPAQPDFNTETALTETALTETALTETALTETALLTLDDLEGETHETLLFVGELDRVIENKLNKLKQIAAKKNTTTLPVLSVQNIQFLLDLHKERETNSPKDVLREKFVLHQLMSYVLRQGVVM